MIREEVGGVEEHPAGLQPLLQERLEHMRLDPMGHRAGEEPLSPLLPLPCSIEAFKVAAEGAGRGGTGGGKEEAESGLVQPLGHGLSAQGFLHAGRELEEEEVLHRVAVEEAARAEPGEGLEETRLPGSVKEGGHLPEFEGLEGLSRARELAKKGIGVPHIDLTDITGP